MADVDIYPFGERESRPDNNSETGENIPLEIVKCGFWHKLPLLPLLWHANAVDEN